MGFFFDPKMQFHYDGQFRSEMHRIELESEARLRAGDLVQSIDRRKSGQGNTSRSYLVADLGYIQLHARVDKRGRRFVIAHLIGWVAEEEECVLGGIAYYDGMG